MARREHSTQYYGAWAFFWTVAGVLFLLGSDFHRVYFAAACLVVAALWLTLGVRDARTRKPRALGS